MPTTSGEERALATGSKSGLSGSGRLTNDPIGSLTRNRSSMPTVPTSTACEAQTKPSPPRMAHRCAAAS